MKNKKKTFTPFEVASRNAFMLCGGIFNSISLSGMIDVAIEADELNPVPEKEKKSFNFDYTPEQMWIDIAETSTINC